MNAASWFVGTSFLLIGVTVIVCWVWAGQQPDAPLDNETVDVRFKDIMSVEFEEQG